MGFKKRLKKGMKKIAKPFRKSYKGLKKAGKYALVKPFVPTKKSTDDPELRLLEPSQGLDEAMIIIQGYTSQDSESPARWINGLRRSGWKGSIYHFWWDASNKAGATRAGIEIPVAGLRLHWSKVKKRAKWAGRDSLGEQVERLPESKISLLGFSLGVRVIYYSLENAPPGRYKDVFLFGGAVRRDSSKDWGGATSALSGQLLNVYNGKDNILKIGFKAFEGTQNPCGLREIKVFHAKIVNVCATDLMDTTKHKAYPEFLPELISTYFETD